MEKDEMYATIGKQLSDRHWGIRAKGKSPGRHPRYYIMDYRGLALATGIIRYTFHRNEPQTRIFYRGQRKDWEIRASLYRKCKNRADAQKANSWLEKVLDTIKPVFDPRGTTDEREALAQHYGLDTRFLDVVDNVQSALWFAYDNISREDPKLDDSVGYIQVLAIPENDTQIIDLRNKPSEWLRPHIQQGFSIKHNNPISALGSFAKYLVATFIVPRESLCLWSNYACLTHDYFYPSDALDVGSKYWKQAEEKMKEEGLETWDN